MEGGKRGERRARRLSKAEEGQRAKYWDVIVRTNREVAGAADEHLLPLDEDELPDDLDERECFACLKQPSADAPFWKTAQLTPGGP